MYRTFGVQIINEQCPHGRTVCPVENYLRNQQNVLRPTINESLYTLAKTIVDADEFVALWNEMKTICTNCKGK